MKNNTLLIIIVIFILGAAGGFFAGMKYQGQKQPASFSQFGNEQQGRMTNQQQDQNKMRAGGGQIMGEIINQDTKSITIKLSDNSTKIILLSDTTTVNKTTAGALSDLMKGQQVAVFGQENSDGSVTAQTVQINPILGKGPNNIQPPQK